MAKILYLTTWKNRSMPGTPIYEVWTETPNGKFSNAVGNITMYSEDKTRKYILQDDNVEICNILQTAYFKDNYEKYGFTTKEMMSIFVEECEEVFTNGHANVCFEEIAREMKEVIGFVVEEYTDPDTYEDMFYVTKGN